ncbi:MAG: DUF1003 domain-containing protein [Nanoarchaeota archaeon]|nr:DUF1003 domain-containing protein [Nanoarchaeota archaeon]
MVKEERGHNIGNYPALTHRWTFGQKAADTVTNFMGSWGFILTFMAFLILWSLMNAFFLISYKLGRPWDPYPFIFLNLILSCLAAIQAPIILMSQNREEQKDRIRAQYDYLVNRKAEREIEEIQKQLSRIEKLIKNPNRSKL